MLKIWNKAKKIDGFFIGKEVFIYNGNKFIKLNVVSDMVNMRFGEFIKTKIVKHNFDKKNKGKKKKK